MMNRAGRNIGPAGSNAAAVRRLCLATDSANQPAAERRLPLQLFFPPNLIPDWFQSII